MWMELPLLILLWKLGGVLPINRLENCFAGGILDLEGNVRELQLSEDYLHTFDQRLTKRGISLNYIGRNKKANSTT